MVARISPWAALAAGPTFSPPAAVTLIVSPLVLWFLNRRAILLSLYHVHKLAAVVRSANSKPPEAVVAFISEPVMVLLAAISPAAALAPVPTLSPPARRVRPACTHSA